MEVEKIMQGLERKHPGELEYLQAVREVLESIKDVYNKHPEFEKAKIVERIVEPERIVTFRVPWVDDKGEVQVNLGYRPLQGWTAFPCFCKSVNTEVPGL